MLENEASSGIHSSFELAASSTNADNNNIINKKCVLCACDRALLLGQGKLNKHPATIHFNTNNLTNLKNFLLNSNDQAIKVISKQQILLKYGLQSVPRGFYTEISRVGWQIEDYKINDMFEFATTTTAPTVNETSYFFAHVNCCAWSYGLETHSDRSTPVNLDKLAYESLIKKCTVCNLYGASVKCCYGDCSEIYHYPCARLAGCFMHTPTHKVLCHSHIRHANTLFDQSDLNCLLCDSADKPYDQLCCTSCGSLFHGSCLSPPIKSAAPFVRLGWQCADCKLCQTCRQPGDDSKVVVCDSCDKCYHTYCLRNSNSVANSSPNGWQCDSCLKQLSLIKICSTCQHPLLLSEPANVHSGYCEHCTSSKRAIAKQTTGSSKPTSKPATATSKKKQTSSKKSNNGKTSGRNQKRSGQLGTVNTRSGGRAGRDTTGKNSSDVKRVGGTNENSQDGESSQQGYIDNEPTIGQIKRDDQDHHAVTIISSVNDSFILKHDMCLTCGSFGTLNEADAALACSQCGQCFHNYCSGVAGVTGVMRERGWRCLDCTVCEGCGTATDEARLILCDDCDISYHIYCLQPPLDHVPQGNWKCKWCVKCVKCGSRTPGSSRLPGSSRRMEWKNNYTECSLCYSVAVCHLCTGSYKEGDLVGKCAGCDRWSHLNCKIPIMSEEDAERQYGPAFYCNTCQDEKNELAIKLKKSNDHVLEIQNESLQFLEELAHLSKRGFMDEGTFLTEIGVELMKKLKVKPAPVSKRRQPPAASRTISQQQSLETARDKQHDENSHSSCDFNDEAGDNPSEKHINMDNKNKPANGPTKRYINIGMGGFNLKFRSRAKMHQQQQQNEANSEASGAQGADANNKRKKKLTTEDMMPPYMQEAFFGMNTLMSCSDGQLPGVSDDDELLTKRLEQEKKVSARESHRIHLDENMLKLAQQKQRGHLELGIDDFLDGDIVSYLFNDNRNLMEFNTDHDLGHAHHSSNVNSSNSAPTAPNTSNSVSSTSGNNTNSQTSNANNKSRLKESGYDEKLFDEKMYEDLFHNIDKNPDSVDDYLNLNSQSIADAVANPFDDPHLHHHPALVKTPSSTSTSAVVSAADTFTNLTDHGMIASPVTSSHHGHSDQLNQLLGSSSNSDHRNIDDLARQFRESTHKYASQNSINGNSGNSQVASVTSSSSTGPVPSSTPANQFIDVKADVNSMLNNAPSNSGFSLIPSDIKLEHLDMNANSNSQVTNRPTSDALAPPSLPPPLPPVLNFEEGELSNDAFGMSLKSGDMLLGGDDLLGESTGAGGLMSGSSKEEMSRHKKLLEKYAEDEELGESATQAISLYCFYHYPNIKNEYKSVVERYRFINKVWRKLDANTKAKFIEMARVNRNSKKKTAVGDGKGSSTLPKSSNSKPGVKRAKSPSNSDKHNSDMENTNFSRSGTPSISFGDDTNDTTSQASHLAFQLKATAAAGAAVASLPPNSSNSQISFGGAVQLNKPFNLDESSNASSKDDKKLHKGEILFDKNMKPIAILDPQTNQISPLPAQFNANIQQAQMYPQASSAQQAATATTAAPGNPIIFYQVPSQQNIDSTGQQNKQQTGDKLKINQIRIPDNQATNANPTPVQPEVKPNKEKFTIKAYLNSQMAASSGNNTASNSAVVSSENPGFQRAKSLVENQSSFKSVEPQQPQQIRLINNAIANPQAQQQQQQQQQSGRPFAIINPTAQPIKLIHTTSVDSSQSVSKVAAINELGHMILIDNKPSASGDQSSSGSSTHQPAGSIILNSNPIQLQPINSIPTSNKTSDVKQIKTESQTNKEHSEDNIDDIIAQVASGSGEIPYNSDSDESDSAVYQESYQIQAEPISLIPRPGTTGVITAGNFMPIEMMQQHHQAQLEQAKTVKKKQQSSFKIIDHLTMKQENNQVQHHQTQSLVIDNNFSGSNQDSQSSSSNSNTANKNIYLISNLSSTQTYPNTGLKLPVVMAADEKDGGSGANNIVFINNSASNLKKLINLNSSGENNVIIAQPANASSNEPSGSKMSEKMMQLDGQVDDNALMSSNDNYSSQANAFQSNQAPLPAAPPSSSHSATKSSYQSTQPQKVVLNYELLNSYGINPPSQSMDDKKMAQKQPSQPQQQPPQAPQYYNNSATSSSVPSTSFDYSMSQNMRPVNSMPQQQQQPGAKSNFIRNLISTENNNYPQYQQYPQNNDPNVMNNNAYQQQPQQPSSQFHPIPQTDQSNQVYHQQQMTSSLVPAQQIPPKMNNDNVLLKALLQTAPKNAAQQPQTVQPHNMQQTSMPSQIIMQQQQQQPVMPPPPAPSVIQAPQSVNMIQQQPQSIVDNRFQEQQSQSNGANNTQTLPKKSKASNKQTLMNDLKNKIIESSQSLEKSNGEAEQVAQPTKKRKKAAPVVSGSAVPVATNIQATQASPVLTNPSSFNPQTAGTSLAVVQHQEENSAESSNDKVISMYYSKLVNEFKQLGMFYMAQPSFSTIYKPKKSSCANFIVKFLNKSDPTIINLPERRHAFIMQHSNAFKINIDPFVPFSLTVDPVSSEQTSSKPKTNNLIDVCLHRPHELLMFNDDLDETEEKRPIKQTFRLCGSGEVKLPKSEKDGDKIKDSGKRVDEVLSEPMVVDTDEAPSTAMTASKPNGTNSQNFIIEELLKKTVKKELSVPTNFNPYSFDQQSAASPVIDMITMSETTNDEQPNTDTTNQDKKMIKTTFKLSNRAANNIQQTMQKLAVLLSINNNNSNGFWDLGAIGASEIKKQETALKTSEKQPKLPLSYTHTDTQLTMTSLTNLMENSYQCRFCDSIITDLYSVSALLQDLEANDNKENRQKPTTMKRLRFCSEYCMNGYKKLVRAKRSNLKLNPAQHPRLVAFLGDCMSDALNNSELNISSSSEIDDSINSILAATTSINTGSGILGPSVMTPGSSVASLLLQSPNSTLRKQQSDLAKRLSTSNILKWSSLIINTLLARYRAGTDSAIHSLSNPSPRFELLSEKTGRETRVCVFCHQMGDMESNGASRLLTLDVDKWCHLNCALWSDEVYETMNGALINVDVAYRKSLEAVCVHCSEKGASLKCFGAKCNYIAHLLCAIKDKCTFNQDKTLYCPAHAAKTPLAAENQLTDLSVSRSVYIERDEVVQIQNFMNRDFDENHYAIRIGSMILHNIGQLLPHQLASGNFNNRSYIYPVGYKATRIYWSINNCFRRCRYLCSIDENDGLPEFTVTVIDEGFERQTFTEKTPNAIWRNILSRIERLRIENDLVKLFSNYFTGEYMFGLMEPHIIRLIESLPGVEMLINYAFKFGRLQLLDMPLTLNPTGCARSEPKLRTHFRKSSKLLCSVNQTGGAHQQPTSITQRSISSASSTSSNNNAPTSTVYFNDADSSSNDEMLNEEDYNTESSALVSYTKQFTMSKSSQVKKLKIEWKSNVYLAKSRIQGLGLFAARDLEKNQMIIEYIGDQIRNEVANRRERLYQSQNRGIYMFRLNDDWVIDATMTGGLARYVNHCCDPNCVAETIACEKEEKIIIIANKRILKGEELTYDYKFDFEDDAEKISCLCGSANCKKWMN